MAPHMDPPYMEPLEWSNQTEPRQGPDEFVETVLEHVRKGLSFTCLGAPGMGKSKRILAKIKEKLLASGEKVVRLALTHAAARQLPDSDTVHHFVGKYAMQGTFKGWILLNGISMCCLSLLTALDQLRWTGTKMCTFAISTYYRNFPNRSHGGDAQPLLRHLRGLGCTGFGATVRALNLADAG